MLGLVLHAGLNEGSMEDSYIHTQASRDGREVLTVISKAV
jgi:hypothetical protein